MVDAEKQKRISHITKLWLSELNSWCKVYDEVEEGYRFLAGDQYTPEQIAWYRSKRRPVNVFNNYLHIFTMYLGM